MNNDSNRIWNHIRGAIFYEQRCVRGNSLISYKSRKMLFFRGSKFQRSRTNLIEFFFLNLLYRLNLSLIHPREKESEIMLSCRNNFFFFCRFFHYYNNRRIPFVFSAVCSNRSLNTSRQWLIERVRVLKKKIFYSIAIKRTPRAICKTKSFNNNNNNNSRGREEQRARL